MKNVKFSLVIACVILALPGALHAQNSITMTLAASPASVDLSDGTSAWAFYGATTNVSDYNTEISAPTTDAGNAGSFTDILATGGGFPAANPGSGLAISYTGGSGGQNPDTLSDSHYYAELQQSQGQGDNLSFTTTLLSSNETLQIYLTNYYTTSNLTASLSDAFGTIAPFGQTILPGSSDGLGSGGSSGVVTLTVTGDIGDILTFTDAVDNTGLDPNAVANQGFNGIVGIQAVTIEAPEPSTWAMLFGGLGVLVFVQRLRAKRNA